MPVSISAIEGNRQCLDGGAMFGNVPRLVWQQWLQPDAQHRIELACRSLLIESGKKKILCETGIGAFFAPKLAERFGVQAPGEHRLLANLQALGISPSEVTDVVLSHLHFDHAGGLLPTYDEITRSGERLVFPNARFIVGREAFMRAQNPHPRDRASFIPGLSDLLQASGRLHLVADGSDTPADLKGLLSFIWSHGHTPGQMHTLVQGEREKVLFCGDLIPGVAWLHLPITMGYDRFPEQVIDEKAKLYQQALAENWLLFYTHDPRTVMSFCEKTGDGKVIAKQAFAACQRYQI